MYSFNKTTGCNFSYVATTVRACKSNLFSFDRFDRFLLYPCSGCAPVAICVVVDVIHVNTCRPLETGGGKQCIIWSGAEHHLSPGGCGWMWLDVETWCGTDPSHHEAQHLSDSRNKTLSECPLLLWSSLWPHYALLVAVLIPRLPGSPTSILNIMRRFSTGQEWNN